VVGWRVPALEVGDLRRKEACPIVRGPSPERREEEEEERKKERKRERAK
jgi:hypothetical protein